MIKLTREPIDLDDFRKEIESPLLGGVVIFIGVVRSVTGDKQTQKILYEAYEEMALEQMKSIACEAESRWNAKVAMVHRLGELLPGDIAVVTISACPHRAEAFQSCQFLIDRLKEDVPIWKKEFGPDGEEWA
jgi:molybdopterin synthase catalytic subunit